MLWLRGGTIKINTQKKAEGDAKKESRKARRKKCDMFKARGGGWGGCCHRPRGKRLARTKKGIFNRVGKQRGGRTAGLGLVLFGR